jgi:hypothetical protein
MIIYVIINAGVWGMLFWPIYRPMSLFASGILHRSSQTNDEETRNRARSANHPPRSVHSTAPAAQISTGQLSNGAAPQFLWD